MKNLESLEVRDTDTNLRTLVKIIKKPEGYYRVFRVEGMALPTFEYVLSPRPCMKEEVVL